MTPPTGGPPTAVAVLGARRVPGPVDVRWVPALVACLLLGQGAPAWDPGTVALISSGCGVAALLAVTALLCTRGERAGRGVLTAIALAGIASAVLTQQWGTSLASAELTGWPRVVAAGEAVRLDVAAQGPAKSSDSRFGPRWSQPVRVTGFGHPARALEEEPSARLTGEGAAEGGLAVGGRACVVAVPRQEAGTLFLTLRAPPVPGSCETAAGRRAAAGTESSGTQSSGTQSSGTESSGTESSGMPDVALADGAASAPTGREHLQAAFRAAASSGVGASPELLPGLVLGDRSAQSPELEQAMKDAGLSHLSAVSGANCALLLGAVTVGLRSLRVHRGAVVLACLATLVVFVIVVGPEPSVLRAAVMGGLGALAVFLGRGRQAFSLLSAGGTLLLLAVPTLATEVAFHLSLAATAGIVLVAAPADRWVQGHLEKVLPGAVARWLSASLAVTVAAHLACQPILLAMTGTVSTWAVPANLAAAPAVAPVTVLGTLAAAVVVPLPAIAAALVWLIQWPAAYIGFVAAVAAGAPGAVRPWPQGPLGIALGVLLTTATLAGFRAVLVLERTPRARVRRVGGSAPARRPSRSAGTVLTAVLVCAAVGGSAAVLVPRPAGSVPTDWAAAFCDVGQGDMTVARTGPRSAVVVDTGPDPEMAVRCLADLHVDHVDALLLTHLHADHAGALDAFTGRLAPDEIRYATRGGAAAAPGGAGPVDPVPLGQEVGIAPPEDAVRLQTGDAGEWGLVAWRVLLADARAAEENDASAQVLLTLERQGRPPVTVLITGDLEEEAAAAWIRGVHSDAVPASPVDVLKVAHHGARNGGLTVPDAVHARLQVISVGADNTYGHPHPATVAGLERLGPVLRTDRHGTVALEVELDGSLTPTTVRPPAAIQ